MQPDADKNGRRFPSALHIVIAGGGTGGHLFPGIAIAQEFMDRNPQNNILFVGTGKPLEISALSATGFRLERITAEGIKGKGLGRQIMSSVKIPKGIVESMMILKRFRPDLVIGVGGYAAGPLAVGAWLLGIPIAIHEQNMLPGITNRVLSLFADRIFVSFENTRIGFDSRKTTITGNPVRREILKRTRTPNIFPLKKIDPDRPFTILIIGGSQGAHRINLAVMEAFEYIKDKKDFYFIHQTGPRDEALVKETYRRQGVRGEIRSFFTDMARQYQNADLIICRAGATTVAEITATGKAVLFVPFPFAADNHQVLNAQRLVDSGAAEMILQQNLDGRILAQRITHYAAHPETLNQMASRARSLGRPQAAGMIVDECYRLVEAVI